MIGYPATDGNNEIIAFDLTAAELFSPGERSAAIPAPHSGEFGSPFEDQQNNPIIRMVDHDIQVLKVEAGGEDGNET
jgi:hypothetical protein